MCSHNNNKRKDKPHTTTAAAAVTLSLSLSSSTINLLSSYFPPNQSVEGERECKFSRFLLSYLKEAIRNQFEERGKNRQNILMLKCTLYRVTRKSCLTKEKNIKHVVANFFSHHLSAQNFFFHVFLHPFPDPEKNALHNVVLGEEEEEDRQQPAQFQKGPFPAAAPKTRVSSFDLDQVRHARGARIGRSQNRKEAASETTAWAKSRS